MSVTPSLVKEVGLFVQQTMVRRIRQQPEVPCGERIYMLLAHSGDVTSVGHVPILDEALHIRELRAYVHQQPGADGVVVVFDAMYDCPTRGQTAAVLLVALHRTGEGYASALPYRYLQLPDVPVSVEFGETIEEPARLDPYKAVFA